MLAICYLLLERAANLQLRKLKKYQVETRLSSKKSVIIVGGFFAGDLAGNRMRES